jgi:hypothetical protein
MDTIKTVCIPSSDTLFSNVVRGRLAAAPEIRSPDQLEEALRSQYPQVRVRPRELAGETNLIWYVYRNGVGFSTAGTTP